MYIPDDGEQEEIKKDEFIKEVMELLFGESATVQNDEGKTIERHFTYSEAIEELKAMDDIYTEYLIKENQ